MVHDILSSSRKMQRKRRVWRLLLILLLLIILVASFVAVFYISKFRIKNINIDGVNILSEDELRSITSNILSQKIAKVFPGDNIFLIDKNAIKDTIFSKFLRIKNINISRGFPDIINIIIEERDTWATLCAINNDGCFLISSDGFLFDDALDFEGGLLLKIRDERAQTIGLGDFIMESEELTRLTTFKNSLEEYMNNVVVKITLKDADVYELHFDGWYTIIDKENEPELAIANFILALNSEIKDGYENLEYVDLRFGNKVFYKFK